MFLKSITSFILAKIILIGSLFGSSSTHIYIAPPPTSTTTAIIKKTEGKIDEKISTSTPQKTKATTTKTTKIPVKKVEEKPVITPTIAKTAEPSPDFTVINTFARSATVNILCTAKGSELSPISGTGVFVGRDGLILTNAHIAQYLLLKDFRQKDFIECVVRTGSPAYPKYKLEIVYISTDWVMKNKSSIKAENPKGTGENDFAFLHITTNIDGSKFDNNVSFVPMNIRENISSGEPVLLASYPAGFLGGISILQDLNITSAVTTIQDVYTFKEGTIDLIAVPGTVVSQKGSSGGLVVDKDATLIGIISTSSDGNTTSSRGLNAITLAHINRSLQSELGINLQQFLSQNIPNIAKNFQETKVPELAKLLMDELLK